MDAIRCCVNRIMFEIPREVLNLAFIAKGQLYGVYPQALENAIVDKVIMDRVRVDLDLKGAVEESISLRDVPFEYTPPGPNAIGGHFWVYKFQPQHTGGRKIISALSCTTQHMLAPYVSTGGLPSIAYAGHENPLLSAANSMLNSQNLMPITDTVRLKVLEPNTVLVSNPVYFSLGMMYMRVLLAHDDTFSDIKPRSYSRLAELAVLAAKAYIYNTLRVELSQGYLHGGQELTAIKDIVDQYADAAQMYQEFLPRIGKIQVMNDAMRYNNLIRLATGYR